MNKRGGGSSSAGRPPNTLLLTFVPWCGFCSRLMQSGGAWDTLKRSHRGLRYREFDADANPAEAKMTGVTTYPDIRAVSDTGATVGKVEPSEASRTFTNLKTFAERNACS